MSIISAYITNLGKYVEGKLVGEWHSFPTTKEDLKQTFRRIGIDGARYEEFFITDYETEIDGIYKLLSEYASIDELNYLSSKLDNMSNYEIQAYEAAISKGEYCGSLKDLINLTDNLDCFDYIDGIEDEYALGYFWIEESGCYDTKDMGNLSTYIDYERFGCDIRLDDGGTFTEKGYIRSNGNTFQENYDGINVPDEYKVFAISKEKLGRQLNKDIFDGRQPNCNELKKVKPKSRGFER